MSFRSLDHTADLAVEVTAVSRDELFAEAVPAFTDTMVDVDRVEALLSRRIELESPEVSLLLVDWLTELLYLFEVEGFLFRRAETTIEDAEGGVRLRAVAWGEPRDDARHPIKVLLKAVTYHGLEVGPKGEAGEVWRARIIFDI
ncbi:MAG TPA: archease [Thermoanaerobaculia bacterium]|nr:archease [Thermoanaerobaculia bacterium]